MIAELAPACTLRTKLPQIVGGVRDCGCIFGIRGHFDVEPVARLSADEFDQLTGVAKVAGAAGGTLRQIATQSHEAANAVRC